MTFRALILSSSSGEDSRRIYPNTYEKTSSRNNPNPHKTGGEVVIGRLAPEIFHTKRKTGTQKPTRLVILAKRPGTRIPKKSTVPTCTDFIMLLISVIMPSEVPCHPSTSGLTCAFLSIVHRLP